MPKLSVHDLLPHVSITFSKSDKLSDKSMTVFPFHDNFPRSPENWSSQKKVTYNQTPASTVWTNHSMTGQEWKPSWATNQSEPPTLHVVERAADPSYCVATNSTEQTSADRRQSIDPYSNGCITLCLSNEQNTTTMSNMSQLDTELSVGSHKAENDCKIVYDRSRENQTSFYNIPTTRINFFVNITTLHFV